MGSVARALFDEVAWVAAAMGYTVDAPCVPVADGARVPLRLLQERLADLERQSGDPDVGLRIGRSLRPAAVGLPGYLAMAGPTLSDALPRVIGCQRLVADGVTLHVRLTASTAVFSLRYDRVEPCRLSSDLLLAGTRFFGAWLLGSQPELADVWFHYPRPARTAVHRELFGVAPRFGSPDDGFALSREWLQQPLRTAAAALVPVLEAQASQELAGLRDDALVARVADEIVALLGRHASVAIGDVAARLHLSPRTLQRRLQAHGTTFNRLLQDLRMTLANRYLADGRLRLVEIAGLLGYQEQSSFCHAYRQWTGRAPSAVRRASRDLRGSS